MKKKFLLLAIQIVRATLDHVETDLIALDYSNQIEWLELELAELQDSIQQYKERR